MKAKVSVITFALLLLMPAYAGAQVPDRIIVPEHFGDYNKGDNLTVHGQIAATIQGSFVITQVTNPRGELCNIQQITPIRDGAFVTKGIALDGRLCGVDGEYNVRIFYDEYVTTSSFNLSSVRAPAMDASQILESAKTTLDSRISRISSISTEAFASRAAQASDIDTVERVYVDLIVESYSDSTLDGVKTSLKRSVSDALDAIDAIIAAEKITQSAAGDIKRTVYTALFYGELGDARTSAARINDAYSAIQEADPQTDPERRVTFESLESTLITLVQRSGVLSPNVQRELAVILARGTAPVYADELRGLLDLLTHARYLDISSRKDDPLHTLINVSWDSLRNSIIKADSLEKTLEKSERVADLYGAAFLLRDLDRVEDFITSDDKSNIAAIIEPEWRVLKSSIRGASSVDGITVFRSEVNDIKSVTDISSRLALVIRISEANGVDTELTSQWPSFLDRLRAADTLGAMLTIVSEFEETITALQNAHSPLDDLKLEYRQLRAKAEQQDDRVALANIDNAISILGLAEKLASQNPTNAKTDRLSVLLAWVSQESDILEARFAAYTQQDDKVRSADILQRAKSLENLAELSLRTKRFVSGYPEYVEDVKETVSRVRQLVIDDELRLADDIIRTALNEWNEVSAAYRDTPPSGGQYGVTDIKRRDYQKHVDDLHSIASRFLPSNAEDSREFNLMLNRANEFTDHGNFVDAQEWITKAYEFAQENFIMEHNSVIYSVTYDEYLRMWVIGGFVNKDRFDSRDDISVIVRNVDGGTHSQLDFTDTKHGEFSVQWDAPSEPGVYIAELLWRDTLSSVIVYVPYDEGGPNASQDRERDSGGPRLVQISKDLFDLREFMSGFGGDRYQAHIGRISPVLADAEEAIQDRDESLALSKVGEIRHLIERYLPQRSPDAVIKTVHGIGGLNVTGAVNKNVEFPEDLYIDIFDQTGTIVTTISIEDDTSGMFSHDLVRSFDSGTYVALLAYHDIRVSDFFTVN